MNRALRTWVRCLRSWGERGNSAVEYALLLPVLIVIVFGAVDFGRAFYAYVTISSAAHEAAIFSARQTAVQVTPAALRTVVARESSGFARIITTPGTGGNTTISGPTLEGVDEQVAKVTLTYQFQPIVPVPLSGPINIVAVAAAPTGGDGAVPTSTPAATATIAPTATPTVPPTATTQPSPTATVGMCTVPNFIGARVNTARTTWQSTFSGTFTGNGSGNFVIQSQSLTPADRVSCSSSITVNG